MVQMANQETALQAGHYSPVVNYNQSAKAPMPIQRQPEIKTDNIDWGRVVGSVASAFSKVSGAYREQEQQNAVTQTNNDLARRYQEVKMDERAGTISATTANTMMDRITMDALNSGMDPKTVSKIYGDYSGGIPALEEDAQKYYNKEQLEHSTAVMNELGKDNEWFRNLNPSDQRTLYNYINDGINRCVQLQQQIDGLDPNSPDYEANKTALENMQQDNSMCQIVTMLGGNEYFMGEKGLNEITMEELKGKFVSYATKPDTYRMSPGQAEFVFDNVARKLGVDNIVGINSRLKDATKKELEDTNTIVKKSIENRAVFNYPEAFEARAVFGNRIFDNALSNNTTLLNSIRAVSTKLVNRAGYGEAAKDVPAEAVPEVVRNTNNTVSSPNASEESKIISARMGVSTVNQFSLPNISQSDEEIKIRLSNSRGAAATLNMPVVKQFANNLKKSDDPQKQQEGKDLENDINKCESAQCFFDTYQRPEWNYVSGIFKDENISTQLRYNEDTGELYYTNNLTPEEAKTAKRLGIGWEMFSNQILNSIGAGAGTLAEKIDYWNNSVASNLKTPEQKIELWKLNNVRPASIGDTKVDLSSIIQGTNKTDMSKLRNNPYVRIGVAAVGGEDPALKTATATVSNSETVGGADVVMPKLMETADLSIWKDVEEYQAVQEQRTFDTEMNTLGAAMEQIESAGNPNAVSDKGARGLMQLMPGTYKDIAKRYGLPEDGIDDPEINRTAGKLYMQELKERYDNDITKTVAAYNMGPTALDKVISKYPNTWEKHLPKETENHIKKFYRALNKMTATASVTKSSVVGGASVMSSRDLARARVKEAADINRPVEESEDVKQLRQQLDIDERKSDLQKLIEKVNDEKLIEAIREFIDRNGTNVE